MNERLRNINSFYKQLGSKTQLIIKTTIILYLSLLSIVLISHFGVGLPNQYDLLLLSEDLIKASRSIIFIGLLGTLIFNKIEKGMTE